MRHRFAAVAFAALVLLPAVAPPASGFGKNKIAYDRFDWKITKTTHFELHHYASDDPDLVRRVSSMAESAYESLARRFNFQIDRPIPLLVYKTHADFEQTNVIHNFIPEGVGAFAEPVRNRMVLPADLPDPALQDLVAHELTHIFEYEILFQGEFRKAILNSPPLWFMEGLASYMADDEDERDRMVLRDAVIAGLIPPITSSGIGGFFAYRFGHAAFDFITETWGPDGVRDFVFEFRSALGNSTEKALQRAFDISPEDFDLRFRRWLQKKHLPNVVEHGEPVDFGDRVRIPKDDARELVSAVPSPSGDLAAAFAVVDDRVEVVQIGLRDRKLLKVLSAGERYGTEYPVVQFLTTGPVTSRDLAWSPDGNSLAWFARRERGRVLVVASALDGAERTVLPIRPDQPLGPSFSADGTKVYFRGVEKGRSDIWSIDLATGEQANVTDDAAYDVSPSPSPDGKWLYYSADDAGRMKIFRLLLADPTQRERVTDGEGSDEDARVSPDGKRLVFSSSRVAGIFNIFSLDLETGEIAQWTDVSSGAFLPSVIRNDDGVDRLLFTAYFRRSFDTYLARMVEPLRVLVPGTEGAAVGRADLAIPERWTPDIDVDVDPATDTDYGRGKLFVEDASVEVGVTSDQRFLSRAWISWADLLGNRRAIVVFDSVSSYSNYHAGYYDLTSRFQKGITLYHQEDFYTTVEFTTEGYRLESERLQSHSGVTLSGTWPFSRSLRLDTGFGYVWRKVDQPLAAYDEGGTVVVWEPRSDAFPEVSAALVGDSTEYRYFGPIAGRRWKIGGLWGYKFSGDAETIRATGFADFRQYLPVTTRSLFALRLYAGISDGAAADVFYFGGLDQLRGYDFRQKIGTRIVYSNIEFRFPLVDQIQFPFVSFSDFRGRIFLDTGAAWVPDQDFDFWDSDANTLRDGLSAYGWGFSWNLGGLSLNWDFAQPWNGRDSIGGLQTTFWIGTSF